MGQLPDPYPIFVILVFVGSKLLTPVTSAAQGFECNGQMYIAHIATNLEARIDVISPDTLMPTFEQIPLVDAALSVVGYSVADEHIYGLDRNNYKIFRINSEGEAEDLGVPQDLDTDKTYYAGGVAPNGRTMYLIGQDPNTGIAEDLFSINILNQPLNAGLVSILSDFPRQIGDIAWDPLTGVVYGFDGMARSLVVVNLFNGLITDFGFQPSTSLPPIGALFFDRQGRLYGFSESGNKMYLFNKFNGTVIREYNGPGGIKADGCGCPYQMAIQKSVVPKQVLPCGEITVIYDLDNTAGRSYSQLIFRDTFPPEFTITEIVKGPVFGIIESGVGSNRLEISQMDIVLDRDSVIIKVDVGHYAQPFYESYVYTSPFPLAFGSVIHSDDPSTLRLGDPTRIEILEADSVFKHEELLFCPETPVVLQAPLDGELYLWNDGSTEAVLETSNPGLYWVEVTGECSTFRDSILLLEQTTPLSIDLGEDRSVLIGEPTLLSFTSNATGNLLVQWTASNAEVLSCINCLNPIISTLEPVVINLWAMDEMGCTASDEMMIGINKVKKFYLPTAFSPNDDGINDVFYPQGEGLVMIRNFEIYNRWGGLVFTVQNGHYNDAAFGWNGKSGQQKVEAGLYIWRIEIEFPDGETLHDQGAVSLIR